MKCGITHPQYIQYCMFSFSMSTINGYLYTLYNIRCPKTAKPLTLVGCVSFYHAPISFSNSGYCSHSNVVSSAGL